MIAHSDKKEELLRKFLNRCPVLDENGDTVELWGLGILASERAVALLNRDEQELRLMDCCHGDPYIKVSPCLLGRFLNGRPSIKSIQRYNSQVDEAWKIVMVIKQRGGFLVVPREDS